MANFQNNAITGAGRNLLSHVQMGAVFEPTRIVLGSGYLPAGTTTRTITEVVSPVKTLTINKKKRASDGTVTIGGVYSNQDVTTDFYFRELALYAKATYPNGTAVAEILYSYGNAGDAAELMPAYSSGNPVERQMDVVTYIGNDSKVNLTIESGMYVTTEQVISMIDESISAKSIPLSQKGAPLGVATLDNNGKLTQGEIPNIDCGIWDSDPIAAHNAAAAAHQNLTVDGNNTAAVDNSQTLEEHMANPNAHQNLIVDGNNT